MRYHVLIAGFFMRGRMGGMSANPLVPILLTGLTLVLVAIAFWPIVLIFVFDVREVGLYLMAIPLWALVAISALLTWRSYASRK